MDKVVHFEIPVDDVPRARGFYGAVFEWGLQPMDEYDYTVALTTPIDEETQMPTEPGAINGGLTPRTPRAEMPGMGAYAYFKDTEGNLIGLWETL
jgi:predicted enzyme related to lactoylglutathione lyase